MPHDANAIEARTIRPLRPLLLFAAAALLGAIAGPACDPDDDDDGQAPPPATEEPSPCPEGFIEQCDCPPEMLSSSDDDEDDEDGDDDDGAGDDDDEDGDDDDGAGDDDGDDDDAAGDDDDDGPGCTCTCEPVAAGKIAFLSIASGNWEAWIADEDGQNPVRITDGLGTNANDGGVDILQFAVFSWDGQHVAVKDRFALYVMDPDGGNLTTVFSGIQTLYQFGWYGDSQHILFTNSSATCNDNLQRIDALTPGATATTIYGPGGIQGHGLPNPTDDNDVLFNNQVCASPGQLWRLDVTAQSAAQVPGTPSFHGRSNWASDGTQFTWANNDVYVQSAAPGALPELVASAPSGSGFSTPAFGNGDQSLYAATCPSTYATCNVARIDLADNSVHPLNVPIDVGALSVTWAEVDIDIDRDGDGLGNAIDPTPDG